MKIRFVMFLVALFATPLSWASMPCLHYGGDPVTLNGPPDYGENPETGSRETQLILVLAEPICVEANPSNYEEAEQQYVIP